jgi:hypothetical protein
MRTLTDDAHAFLVVGLIMAAKQFERNARELRVDDCSPTCLPMAAALDRQGKKFRDLAMMISSSQSVTLVGSDARKDTMLSLAQSHDLVLLLDS